MISARILKHSVNTDDDEIITWELTYPRFIHSEMMTHRMFSRNSASSRAIPVKEMLREVRQRPAVPLHWGANSRGMQAKGELSGWRRWVARRLWLAARWPVLVVVWLLTRVGLHKQVANRLLEPWLHMTIVMTATEHENFFMLRDHPDAQPEFAELARRMSKLRMVSQPQVLQEGEWHIPMLDGEEEWRLRNAGFGNDDVAIPLVKIATARCARASYIKHLVRKTPEEDIKMHDRLASSKHWSPFEHCAQAAPGEGWIGNFRGWRQYRKLFEGESGRSRG